MAEANSNIPTYSSILKGQIEMALRYRIPFSGPFYYSVRVSWGARSSGLGESLP